MQTLRERFEMAVARGELDDAERYAAQMAEQFPADARDRAAALDALRRGKRQEAWEHAVDARWRLP